MYSWHESSNPHFNISARVCVNLFEHKNGKNIKMETKTLKYKKVRNQKS